MSEEERVINKLVADNKALRDLVDWQAAENKMLREALRYYAANHYPNVDDGPWGQGSNDFGDVARAALGEGKE